MRGAYGCVCACCVCIERGGVVCQELAPPSPCCHIPLDQAVISSSSRVGRPQMFHGRRSCLSSSSGVEGRVVFLIDLCTARDHVPPHSLQCSLQEMSGVYHRYSPVEISPPLLSYFFLSYFSSFPSSTSNFLQPVCSRFAAVLHSPAGRFEKHSWNMPPLRDLKRQGAPLAALTAVWHSSPLDNNTRASKRPLPDHHKLSP